jgi:hypothetical protein
VIDEECFLGLSLNAAGNALAVARAKEQGLQNQQVQGALQQGDAIVFFLMGRHTARVSRSSGRMSTCLRHAVIARTTAKAEADGNPGS